MTKAARKMSVMHAFLQRGVGPDDPVALAPSEKMHIFRSDDILDTLGSMLKELNAKSHETQDQWRKAEAACTPERTAEVSKVLSGSDLDKTSILEVRAELERRAGLK